jgi:osmotically-inducible protein OsmY
MKGGNLNEICPTIRCRKAIDIFTRTRLPRVNVKTVDGSVNLSGTVLSLEAREHAVKLASRVAGVQAVVNHLEVKK